MLLCRSITSTINSSLVYLGRTKRNNKSAILHKIKFNQFYVTMIVKLICSCYVFFYSSLFGNYWYYFGIELNLSFSLHIRSLIKLKLVSHDRRSMTMQWVQYSLTNFVPSFIITYNHFSIVKLLNFNNN